MHVGCHSPPLQRYSLIFPTCNSNSLFWHPASPVPTATSRRRLCVRWMPCVNRRVSRTPVVPTRMVSILLAAPSRILLGMNGGLWRWLTMQVRICVFVPHTYASSVDFRHDCWSVSFSSLWPNYIYSLCLCPFLTPSPLYLVLDKEAAWTQILELPSFGSGNSRANSLFWTASRPPPVPGFNSSALIEANRKEPLVKSSCASNSACDAIGTTLHMNHILGLDKFYVHLIYFSCWQAWRMSVAPAMRALSWAVVLIWARSEDYELAAQSRILSNFSATWTLFTQWRTEVSGEDSQLV